MTTTIHIGDCRETLRGLAGGGAAMFAGGRLTFGSLFAGIGGLDLGLERAGMRCVWQVEVDDYATKVLEKHWPDVARFRDVRDCGADNLKAVDLICGGFPCQDVSLAGKRAGLKGKRTTLWSEFARIIRELRPGWVLAENVPGLYSSDSGRFFGQVLRDLAESGYDAEWDCIPAAAVGAPHRRYRVFIVAHTQSSDARQSWKQSADQREGTPHQEIGQGFRNQSAGCSEDVANSNRARQLQSQGSEQEQWRRVGNSSEDVADTEHNESHRAQADEAKPQGDGAQNGLPVRIGHWAVEPDVGRVAHGVPSRVDRLRCLGNAVVPQVAEWIGERIKHHEDHSS